MSSNNHNDVDDAAAATATATATAAAAATNVVKDDVDPKSDLQRRRRTGLLVFSIIYTVLYVGAYFGWGPMQLLFEDHGFFSWKCDDDFVPERDAEDAICPDQTAALLNVNMVGQLTQITSPILGYIADLYGAKVLANMMALTCWLGLALVLVAAETGVDQLLYIAFACLGMTTWMGGLLTVQTGLYFKGKMQSRVIFALNALFDAGSVTYLGVWGIGEWTGASVTVLISGYLVLAVLVFGGALYFWSVAVPDSDQEEEEKDIVRKYDTTVESSVAVPETAYNDDGSGKEQLSCTPPQIAMPPELEAAQLERGDGTTFLKEPETKAGTAVTATAPLDNKPELKAVDTEPSLNEDDADADTDMKKHTTDNNDPPGEKEYILIADRRSRQQLTSGQYLLLVVFFSFHLMENQWNLTTQRDFLAYLGDDEQDNKYLTIFTLLMPASIVGLPFVDAAITQYGFVGGLQGINLLGLAYNVIKISSDNLNCQILGFIFFSFYRCFLFSVTFGILPTFLDQKVIGKAAGILYFSGGITNFLNIPMKDLAVKHLDGDFFVPNLVYTILLLPCIAAAWGIGQAIEREKAAKEVEIRDKLEATYDSTLVKNDTK